MGAYTKGYVVMMMNDDYPSGKAVSRTFHVRQAAVDFAELAAKTDTKSRYYVGDKVGYDKGKGDIK